MGEPGNVKATHPESWIATLYDRFQNIQDLEFTQRTRYPDGEQFVYDFDLNTSDTLRKEVRLFSRRLTLLHVFNVQDLQEVKLSFTGGPDLTHVLTSSAGAPKTLFDFDQVHSDPHGNVQKVHVDMVSKTGIWCALFAGDEDASVVVTASTFT